MNTIGASPPRPDGFAKAAGEACYADDLIVPGMWYGATVRSPHAHARLADLSWAPAGAGGEAVCVTARELPGPNGVQLVDDSWPILADRFVRHVGEPVAVLAAPTRRAAQAARQAVAIQYEPLPAVLSLEEAAALPPLAAVAMETGSVDETMAGADRVIEGVYRSGHQEHVYIECQGMTAWFEPDGGLVVYGSMQCPYYVHKALVHAFGLPAEAVRVRASEVGGGFGGKEDFPSLIAIHAALLARATGRPVRLAYDRGEDIIGTTKRHPAVIRHRTGVAADGRLAAMDIEIVLDGGAYRTLSPVVLSRALLHAFGPYRCDHVRIRGRVLRTNTPPNGAFRGFGAPQVEFAVERQMDRIARLLGLDPFAIRERNVVGPGDRLPTGQLLDSSAAARLCLEEVELRTGFRARWRECEAARTRRRDGEPLPGIGLSLYFHGAGFTGNGERSMRSPVTARLTDEGRVEVLTATTDMGQGSAAVFPQIAAAAGGLATEDLVFTAPDTGQVPDSGPTVASRTTMIVGAAIARAVADLTGQVAAWWSTSRAGGAALCLADGNLTGAAEDIAFRRAAQAYVEEVGPLTVTVRHQPPPGHSFDEARYQGDAYPTYAWGADVVELEVDPDTLAVKPLKVTAVCEVGRAIHPTLCAGQIEGGTLQALGFALMEEIKMRDGRYLNDRLATYIIPTITDSPQIAVHLLERPWEGGPFGAKGIGELPMDGGAPAAAAAIENATGIAVAEIPATPERLHEWRRDGGDAGP
ncbi:MAG TPA: xanthine dehydrogenase family protein molybdopterin-binding subunit [Thermoanaerobaculia bacterium]|nr:xanthine dehydrogenase family protein molybdopterin-binding subunit [Thermoanaerobaculia bacterium]